MHQRKRERIAYFICAVGIVLLLMLFGMLCVFPKNSNKTVSPEEVSSEELTPVVLSGMKFFIPEGFKCYPHEESGMLIYREDAVIWLGVLEDSYEELQKKKEELIPQAEDKGYTCIAPVEEYQTEQRCYLYFVIDNDERTQYIIYSPAGADSHFGIIVDAPDWAKEEVMKVVDTVVGAAQETEMEDTSVYDLLLIHPDPVERKFSSEGVLQNEQENTIISFQIPEGFYADEGYKDTEIIGNSKSFTDYDAKIFVTVSLIADEESIGAENYIRRQSLFFASTDLGITQAVMNGKTVYYFSENHAEIYENFQEQYYNFYAVIDLEHGQLYKLNGFSLSNPNALEPETYEEFLTIEIEPPQSK